MVRALLLPGSEVGSQDSQPVTGPVTCERSPSGRTAKPGGGAVCCERQQVYRLSTAPLPSTLRKIERQCKVVDSYTGLPLPYTADRVPLHRAQGTPNTGAR